MRSEGCLGNVLWIHAHLIIPRTEIELGKELGVVQLVQKFLYNWDGELVLQCALVEGSVINTKAPSAIGLHDEENRC